MGASRREWSDGWMENKVVYERVSERVIKINYRHSRLKSFFMSKLSTSNFLCDFIFFFLRNFFIFFSPVSSSSEYEKGELHRGCFHCNKAHCDARQAERSGWCSTFILENFVHFFTLVSQNYLATFFSTPTGFYLDERKNPAELLASANERLQKAVFCVWVIYVIMK